MKTNKATPYIFLAPYLIMFAIFIVIPIIVAIALSLTNFDTIQTPEWAGCGESFSPVTGPVTSTLT